MKKVWSWILALSLCLGLCSTAMAQGRTVNLDIQWDQPDGSFRVAETAGAGELRLESAALEAAGTFINLEGWKEEFPVYRAAAPVTVTLTGGLTREELAALGTDEDGERIVEGNAVLTVNQVTYDAQSRRIALVKENAACFDGTVFDFASRRELTIAEHLADPNAEDASRAVAKGASVTLSQPGTYQIRTYWHWTAGACETVIIVGDAPAAPAGGFTDVKESDWFYQPVQWAVDQKITAGTSATTFSPNRDCMVSEILTFLWRAAGSPAAKALEGMDQSQFYAKAAAWAAEKGILAPEDFQPAKLCTRAMAVEFIWGAKGSPEAGDASFDDVLADETYTHAVAWAVEHGVTAGTSPTTFSPNDICNRGQIVSFLYRAFSSK